MSHSKGLFCFYLLFISGVLIASFLKIPPSYLWGFLIFGVILIFSLFFYFPKRKYFLAGFFILFLILGISRYQMAEFRIKNSELKKFNGLQKEVILIGKISEEPDIRENSTKLVISTETITETELRNAELWEARLPTIKTVAIKGKVLVTTGKYPQYQYGDRLEITGKLLTPREFEGFNYQKYLAKEGIHSVMYNPKIEKISHPDGGLTSIISVVYKEILVFKEKLRNSINRIILPPESSILGAMILGDKSKIPEDLKEKLNTAGVRHITAISGMHIVILSGILLDVFLAIGFWRGQAFYLTLAVISLFIAMSGFQPSAIRASIMGGILLLGQKIGRTASTSRNLAFVAFVMLMANPLLLRCDISFQLSFLAVAGIVYTGPIFNKLLKFFPDNFLNLRSTLVMTFSAQVFTIPLLVYNFGKISLVSPLTNVLILPIVAWIMISGFVFAVAGIIYQPIGLILSFPCLVLLLYLTKVVDVFAELSISSISFEVPWFWLIFVYLSLFSIIFIFRKKLTDKKLIVY